MTTPVLVLGTRPYTEVLIDMFEGLPGIRFSGSVENQDRARCGETLAGLPIHWFQDIDALAESHLLTCALATTHRAGWIADMAGRGFGFARLVHPSSVVSRRTELGEGAIVDAGCVVAGFTRIGPHVRIGRRASIGHHGEIGPFTTIHPGAILSGNCRIGASVTLGTGAVVIDGITIGEGAVVAAGAVVNRDVAPRALVAGNPAVEKRTDYGPR